MSDGSSQRLGLFDAFGVELEYMIVAKESLDVQPVCDRLIESECVVDGRLLWGVGVSSSIVTASLRAVISAANRAVRG